MSSIQKWTQCQDRMAGTVTDLAKLGTTLEQQPPTGGAQPAERESMLQVTSPLPTCTLAVHVAKVKRQLIFLQLCTFEGLIFNLLLAPF